MPTGTTPSASGTSWLPQFTQAMFFGFSGISVLPRACFTVSGNEASPPDAPPSEAPLSGPEPPAASSEDSPEAEQAASARADRARPEPSRLRRRMGWVMVSFGPEGSRERTG
jgi:hypothetical protein